MVILEKIRVRNDVIHKKVKIAPIGNKLRGLGWFGHAQHWPRDAPMSNFIYVE